MPQQFLHDFEFRAHASQQRRIRVTKRVPADAFLDSSSLRNRPMKVREQQMKADSIGAWPR
jgi:hypothetical protein